MCYKDEKQLKLQNKLESQLDEENVPRFIRDFFKSKSKLKSRQAHLQYWNNFSHFFKYLLDNQIINKNNISEITTDDILLIKKTHIIQYLNYCRDTRGNGLGTLNFKLNSISSLFSYFVDDEIIQKDVTNGIELDKPERKPLKYAKPEDVRQLIDNLDNIKNEYDRIRNIAIADLFFGSGIRCDELVGLNVLDLFLEDEIPNIKVRRKGGDTDYVDITQDAKISLLEYLAIREEREIMKQEDKDALFISERKRRMSDSAMRKFIKEYGKNNLTPHMFRKGLGMEIYNNSGDLHMAAEQLGHSSDQTTSRWYVTTDRNRRANIMNNIMK